jgi:DNA mismatch repair protein MutL
LQIAMPPEAVDVNVHPTKLEVRFQDGGRIYSQLLGTLRTKFLTIDLTSKLQPTISSPSSTATTTDVEVAIQARQRIAAWMTGTTNRLPATADSKLWAETSPPPVEAASAFPDPPSDFPRSGAPLTLNKLDRPPSSTWSTHPSGRPGAVWHTPATERRPTADQGAAESLKPAEAPSSEAPAHWEPLASADRPFLSDNLRPTAIQVHNRYLIAESEEGIVIIDQHALHERILYEQIREKVLTGAMESQRLLVPEPVDLGAAEAAAVLDAAETLSRLGVLVEPFGGDTVLITSYPAMLANFRPVEVLREIVDKLTSDRQPDRRDLLDELLHMISCKAAIKAGDRLSSEEVAALVQQRHLYQDSHHCPHGRPTSLVFSRAELDRQFMRT